MVGWGGGIGIEICTQFTHSRVTIHKLRTRHALHFLYALTRHAFPLHSHVSRLTRTRASPCRRVSHVCEDTLGFLKQTKHKAWRDGMLGIFGNCAKAFIPSLKQGLITRMCLPLYPAARVPLLNARAQV